MRLSHLVHLLRDYSVRCVSLAVSLRLDAVRSLSLAGSSAFRVL
jgi:hypothetical protein